jgi:hypothetical protein
VATFGIIAEGITDQIVIESILRGYLGDQDDELVVNPVQPPLDATAQGGGPPPAGWTLVFRSLRDGEHRKALQFNDYIIVHIDTDVCDDKGFDVPKNNQAGPLPVEALVERVTARLKKAMGDDFCVAHGHRVIFAIAVHQIECWLLPLFFENEDRKAEKIAGCLSAVDEQRRRQNKLLFTRGGGKEPRVYREVARDYARRKILMKHYHRNPSLKVFIEGLDAMRLDAQPSTVGP